MPFPYPVDHLTLTQAAPLAHNIEGGLYCTECCGVLGADTGLIADLVFVAYDCGLTCSGCPKLLGQEVL